MGFWFLVETIPTYRNPNRGRKMFLKKQSFHSLSVNQPLNTVTDWLCLQVFQTTDKNCFEGRFWACPRGTIVSEILPAQHTWVQNLGPQTISTKNVNKWTQVAPSRRTSPSTPPLVGGRWRMSDRHGVLMEQQEAGLVNTLASALGDSLARLLTACVF